MTDDELEIVKLKADAYDCLAQVEQWQAKLRQVNEKIAELLRKPPVPPNG